MPKLSEIAKTIRSKNAGVNQITFDIFFPDKATYERVVKSGSVTPETIAKLYGIEKERLSDFVNFDVANAIKFTIYRRIPSGSPGDWDMLGTQFYAPLIDLEVAV